MRTSVSQGKIRCLSGSVEKSTPRSLAVPRHFGTAGQSLCVACLQGKGSYLWVDRAGDGKCSCSHRRLSPAWRARKKIMINFAPAFLPLDALAKMLSIFLLFFSKKSYQEGRFHRDEWIKSWFQAIQASPWPLPPSPIDHQIISQPRSPSSSRSGVPGSSYNAGFVPEPGRGSGLQKYSSTDLEACP